MQATQLIRDAVARVTLLRQTAADNPALQRAVSEVKLLQARRFAGTYRDLLASAHYRPATVFFLEELYGEKDYSERDAQFARIASALERLFPKQVAQTAVALAQLHGLTEELDLAMAQHWLNQPVASEAARYLAAWRAVNRRADRIFQLESVLNLGRELDRLTRTPGLRLMLKMMRGPANVAGLGSLQAFLETGFDTFAAMRGKGEGTRYFLDSVQTRESALITRLFDADAPTCQTEIARLLGPV